MFTVAVCTYNRSSYLPNLIRALREQESPIPFEILVINNNSNDDTGEVLEELIDMPGPALRVIPEQRQGIVHARNRAISESLNSEYLLFMDDDELPCPGLVHSAYSTLINEKADCVGGRVQVNFSNQQRPAWLTDDLLGFLAEINYGAEAFRITNAETPVWTANIAYRMQIFRDNEKLRFDIRYNREGEGVGGGEDIVMFNTLLSNNYKIFYEPKMVVEHFVESWRLKKSYFLKLHYNSGVKSGRYELQEFDNLLFGSPIFLYRQLLEQTVKALVYFVTRSPARIRQAMNASHALGLIFGYRKRRAGVND